MNNVDLGRYSKRIVQYIWDPEPSPTDAEHPSPVWCLGQSYELNAKSKDQTKQSAASSPSSTPHARASSSVEDAASGVRSAESSFEEVKKTMDLVTAAPQLEWPKGFLDDFESRIWMTYRSGFPEIAKSSDPNAPSHMSLAVRLKSQLSATHGFSSDAGWGCMIRSGQCVLANAIALLRLGRDWRRGELHPKEGEILRLFADDHAAPFSIHRFVEHGAAACGTYPGQWFGPSATAKCIEALSNGGQDNDLKTYVTGDGPDVFEDRLLALAKDGDGEFQPTLLLIGTRLGIDRVTPAYWPALKACLQMPQSVGIAGGRPSASHYFVGLQDDDFYYLDPHQTRPALPLRACDNYTIDEVDSCHTRRLRKLPLAEMDPSMLIAFLIRNEADWRDWRRRITDIAGKSIVHVADTEPAAHAMGGERDGALDEVEILDDTEEEDEDAATPQATTAATEERNP